MEKIRTYKISPKGDRGRSMTIPPEWARDVGAEIGDYVDMYRENNTLYVVKTGDQPQPLADSILKQLRGIKADLKKLREDLK